jgi:hypothetical protein
MDDKYDGRDEFVGGVGRGGGAEPRDDQHKSGGERSDYRSQGHRLDARSTPDPGAGRRHEGVRRVRHMSNWTAAALLAGTGVATVALATHATQTAGTTTTSASSTQGTSVQPGAPHVHSSVVTSGGSGATVTTTTKMVNGHAVVTKVRHPAVWHDN